MSTGETWQIDCSSLEATLALAKDIGARLRGGELLVLMSDLGGGKTTFVRGLAAGMGSPDHVSSPSFTISNMYQSPTLTLSHFDFYRLQEPGVMAQELAEVLDDSHAVTVIEWATIVESILPERRLEITIMPTSEKARRFSLRAPSELSYLVPKEQL